MHVQLYLGLPIVPRRRLPIDERTVHRVVLPERLEPVVHHKPRRQPVFLWPGIASWQDLRSNRLPRRVSPPGPDRVASVLADLRNATDRVAWAARTEQLCTHRYDMNDVTDGVYKALAATASHVGNSAYFTPTRQGEYVVEMAVDDGCS